METSDGDTPLEFQDLRFIVSKFYLCEKCNKKLIERGENGMWHFVFGKSKDENGNLLGIPPVDIYVWGSLKMRCLRRGCGHWNVLDFFPFSTREKIVK